MTNFTIYIFLGMMCKLNGRRKFENNMALNNSVYRNLDSLHQKILSSNFAEQVTESEIIALCETKNAYRKKDTNGWILCKDRLPEEKENPITKDFYEYQVTFQSDDVLDIRHYKFGKGHWWNYGEIMDEYVIAWLPLPKPYKKQQKKHKIPLM